MTRKIDVLCIGAIQSDLLGIAPDRIEAGDDVPGSIKSTVGGVAYRVAKALQNNGCRSALFSVVGEDTSGAWLRKQATESGLSACEFLTAQECSSGAYLAIEAGQELVAAVADCRAIELCGRELLELAAARFPASRFSKGARRIVVDTNLLPGHLSQVAGGELYGDAKVSVVVASNHKLDGVRAFAGRSQTVIYLNLAEANRLIPGTSRLHSAVDAAASLCKLGYERVVVTNGARTAADCNSDGPVSVTPKPALSMQATGAGDRLAACHIARTIAGDKRGDALLAACGLAVRD
ncbi:MAG: PfkB family carbohydrate kinase [Rhodobacteraceae bacterium]|nr:PfkB family carbohydrate kinase [Paracoccaceae bacterium]